MIYVALLRGINVGGNNKVAMPMLAKLFLSLGFTDVRTYINSGNVIFSAPACDEALLAQTIEQAIEKSFGFPVRTIVRTETHIATICAQVPKKWQNNTEQKTDVLFLWDAYDSEKTRALIQTTPGVDELIYIAKAGVILWHVDRANYAKSGMHSFVGSAVYIHMTARNINTVRKLDTLMGKEGAHKSAV